LALQCVGWLLGTAALCGLAGTWLAVLAFVHVGHKVATANWGTPLYRALVVYTLRNLGESAATFPRQAAYAAAGLAAAFAAGALVGWADVRADLLVPSRLGFWPTLLASGGLALALAVVVRLRGLAGQGWDPLVSLVCGHSSVDLAMPPYDPSLTEALPPGGPREPARRATVVLFVVDSLRARNLPFYGYGRPTAPFLTSWVEQQGAQVVPVAVSPCLSSEHGIWTVLSSRGYRHHAINSLNLHDVLHAAGYKVRFFLSGSHRGWRGLEKLYGRGHEQFLEGLPDTGLLAEVAKLPPKDPAFGDFLHVHLMSVHSSGRLHAKFEHWRPWQNRVNLLEHDRFDAQTVERVVNHYDNTVLQADAYIRQICERLGEKGYLRDAVLIVTADHAEALGERPGYYLGHAWSLFQESIHVPIVVCDTTQALPEAALLADLTDVAPTIAHLLGIEPPRSWQGQSVFREPFRRDVYAEYTTYAGGLPGGRRRAMEAVLSRLPGGLYKMIWHQEEGLETFRSAFGLAADPREMRPITDPAILAELAARRDAFLQLPVCEAGKVRLADFPSRRSATVAGGPK